jgi:electron-transferring-flavoprotein dehydrogenase
MVDMQKLKGIHLAMKSGMLAAEHIFECLKSGRDFTSENLAPYEEAVRRSYIGKSLKRVRHFHKALSQGMPRALFHLGLQHVSGGGDIQSYDRIEDDYETTKSVAGYYGVAIKSPEEPEYDGNYTLDKLSDIYISGTQHDEDQPSHLKVLSNTVCMEDCVPNYRYPCNRFCPAKVYEMLTDEGNGALKLQVNFTNCVHCQTCDIKCPLNNIRWTPPEGGQGPAYTLL